MVPERAAATSFYACPVNRRERRAARREQSTHSVIEAIQELALLRALRQLADGWAGPTDVVAIVVLVTENSPFEGMPGIDGGFYAVLLPRRDAVEMIRVHARRTGKRQAAIESIAANVERGDGDDVQCAILIGGYEGIGVLERDALEDLSKEPPEIAELTRNCLFRSRALQLLDEQYETLKREHGVASEALVRVREVVVDRWSNTRAILEVIASHHSPTFPDDHAERIVSVTLEVLARATRERVIAARAGLPPPPDDPSSLQDDPKKTTVH